MKPIAKIFVSLLIVTLALSACVTQQPATATESSQGGVQTIVAQTIEAMSTLTAAVPTATTAAPTEVIPTEMPTFTSVPTLEPTATNVPPTPTAIQSLVVGSVEDLTIPAGTTLKGGQTFVKKWRITNGGSAAWAADYYIVYVSGDRLGVSSIQLGKVVNPGESYTVSVTFTAPTAVGDHQTNFMMETNNGYKFGLGKSAGSPWSIRITTSTVFAVTAASLAASPTSYSGTCPSTIKFTPTITANGSGKVTYVIRFDNGATDTYEIDFSASGSATGTVVSWPVDSTMTSLTAHIYISEPNHQDFPALTVAVTCTP
jgi:hypothetical protein